MTSSIVSTVKHFYNTVHPVTWPIPDEKNFYTTNEKISPLGVTRPTRKDINYAIPKKRGHGRIRQKRRKLEHKPTTMPLIDLIKTRYAFLLRPTADGTTYEIDMTLMSTLPMRKRYASMGCKITVDKELTKATVSHVASNVPVSVTSTLAEIEKYASIVLSVFALIIHICIQIYSIIAPLLGMASVRTIDPTDLNTATPLQKILWPFHVGLPEFLEKMETYMFGDGNLLYHLTGMQYSEMINWMKAHMTEVEHSIINPFKTIGDNAAWMALPVVELGKRYFDAITIYFKDLVENKNTFTDDELEARIGITTWGHAIQATAREQWVLMIWMTTFLHTLLSRAVYEVFSELGSVMTKEGDILFAGVQHVVQVLELFFSSISASTLTFSSAPVQGEKCSMVLRRKSATLEQEFSNGKYSGYEFLAPQRVHLTLL